MNPFRRLIRSLYTRFAVSSRQKKFDLFTSLFHIDDSSRLLDVGFSKHFAHQYILEDYLPSEIPVVGGEIDEQALRRTIGSYPQVHAVVLDACHLPFFDQSFDVVYSNAVIEHVGDYSHQRLFADEVRRVGRSWFVTTPNFWFPIDTHTSLPFVHWLPKRWRLAVFRSVGRKGDLVLLTGRRFRQLFPESTLFHLRTTILPEVLVAFSPQPDE
jgi:hypothetical protein